MADKRRIWQNIHIVIDEESLVVRAVDVTTSNVGDAPMLASYAIKSHSIRALDRFPRTAPMTGSPDFDPDCLLGYAVSWPGFLPRMIIDNRSSSVTSSMSTVPTS